MTPKEYLEARLEMVRKIDALGFQETVHLTDAAVRLTRTEAVKLSKGVMEATLCAALKLQEAYPAGLPLTFTQILELDAEDMPSQAEMVAWWSGDERVVEKVE